MAMLPLKSYQQDTLDWIRAYFQLARTKNDVDLAFYSITEQTRGQRIGYNPVRELPGLPYICLRIPTGGGKTLVAARAIDVTVHNLLAADRAVVLWLAPTNVIRDQTLRALSNPAHPYRLALEAGIGPVTVLSLGQALYLQPATLNSATVVIVATMAALRVNDTEGRKVYESSGKLMSHFGYLDEAQKTSLEMIDGADIPKKSLANVLHLRRPIVIVDEAHNARTQLSFETLARFNPACILEFTATPKPESNVLFSVSAARLKADAMIKLPIQLRVRQPWKDLLAESIAQRSLLEAAARLEKEQTGEYIRPILLIQAQPRSQVRETLTVARVRQTLLDDFKILPEQIAVATGELDELGDQDISRPDCPIRYIITVQALREGWDCPFAYVLCSLAESRSSTAIEQILGRVLRLPAAIRKVEDSLNRAYAFVASAQFAEVADNLKDSLVQNGFEEFEARGMVTAYQPAFPLQNSLHHPVHIQISALPDLDSLPPETAAKLTYNTQVGQLSIISELAAEEYRLLHSLLYQTEPVSATALEKAQYTLTPALLQPMEGDDVDEIRPSSLSVPWLARRCGHQLELFEESALMEVPWRLSQCNAYMDPGEYSAPDAAGIEMALDITEHGKIARKDAPADFLSQLQNRMKLFSTDQGWTEAELVYWIDRSIYHPDISFTESTPFLAALVRSLIERRGFTLEDLVSDKYRLSQAATAKIHAHRMATRRRTYQAYLLPEYATPLVVDPSCCFNYRPDEYPYNQLYRGMYPFQKHFYPQVGDLEDHGEEFQCAVYLDRLPEVKTWVRNLERRPHHSFWLQTSTDRFYPDFVCLLNDGRYLAVEYKGVDRWSNDDSREKRTIGEVWEKRSNGLCLFVMPEGLDWGAIRTKI
jgi:type III restriction enzyme